MVQTLKCVVVDDEPLAAALIKSYIEASDHLEIGAVFEDAIAAGYETASACSQAIGDTPLRLRLRAKGLLH